MIVRLVTLTIDSDRVDDFLSLFSEYRSSISNFPGCQKLDLLNDMDDPQVYVTYSHWDTAEDLEAYRKSALFQEIWPATKLLFSDKPQARSFHLK